MTNPSTDYNPIHTDPPPAPKPRRWWTTPVIVVVSVLAGIGIGAASAGSEGQPVTSEALQEWERQLDEREDALNAEQDTPSAPVEEEPEPEQVAEFDTPAAGDFTLTARTLEQECFGSAGCLVTFQIDAGWTLNLDPGVTYEVTYEVQGADDPYINTLEVQGDEYWVEESEMVGTPSSESKLTVHVLEVREQ